MVWTRIDGMIFGGIVVSAIAVHPRDKNNILVCIGGTRVPHVWRCRDTTATPPVWENVSGSGADALVTTWPIGRQAPLRLARPGARLET